MKEIDVQPQPILSPQRTMQIAVAGVKYRLFRAIVTVAVIVVAMAFLMNILTESLVRRSVAVSARAQIDNLHRVDLWIARLSIAQSPSEIIRGMAGQAGGETYARELGELMKADRTEVLQSRELAVSASSYLDFFEDLPFGRRRILAGRAEGPEIFTRLAEAEHFARFEAGLADMKSVNLPGSLAAFRAFLDSWKDLKSFISRARDAQAKAIQAIRSDLGDKPLLDAMLDAQGSFGETIRKAGFRLEPAEAAALATDVERVQNTARIEKTINNAGVRREVAASEDMLPGDVTIGLIWDMVEDRETARWFLDTMKINNSDIGKMTPEVLQGLAAHRAEANLLKKAERQTTEAGGGFLGIGKRMTWLALVSMLVCAVGITNAMLMSVTERFREIATLKCLGALDGFIMLVFLIEAAFLGLVGGVGGTIVGFLLGAGRMLLTFKSLMVSAMPMQDLAIAGIISILAGVILAAAAAVYPSLRAAKLAPMEAMRIE